MLDFTINSENILILFGAYLTFFTVVFGISRSISLFKERF